MNDAELTRLCAEAMGYRTHSESEKVYFNAELGASILKSQWEPLADDAQCMALVKKFRLTIADQTEGVYAREGAWSVWWPSEGKRCLGRQGHDLNRCVCELIAQKGQGRGLDDD